MVTVETLYDEAARLRIALRDNGHAMSTAEVEEARERLRVLRRAARRGARSPSALPRARSRDRVEGWQRPTRAPEHQRVRVTPGGLEATYRLALRLAVAEAGPVPSNPGEAALRRSRIVTSVPMPGGLDAERGEAVRLSVFEDWPRLRGGLRREARDDSGDVVVPRPARALERERVRRGGTR